MKNNTNPVFVAAIVLIVTLSILAVLIPYTSSEEPVALPPVEQKEKVDMDSLVDALKKSEKELQKTFGTVDDHKQTIMVFFQHDRHAAHEFIFDDGHFGEIILEQGDLKRREPNGTIKTYASGVSEWDALN